MVEEIRKFYRLVAEHPEKQAEIVLGKSLAGQLGYPPEDLRRLPDKVLQSFAGVGYHFDIANLMGGENVLDLGSGSGADAFLAGIKVGKTGKVVGIDMTAEQVKKAELASKGLNMNISFKNEMFEQISFENSFFDIVMSNGALNLSLEKEKVLAEIARVLRYAGRMATSFFTTRIKIPEHLQNDPALWASGIAGAFEEHMYREMITNAGLQVVYVKENVYPFTEKLRGIVERFHIKSVSVLAEKIHTF